MGNHHFSFVRPPYISCIITIIIYWDIRHNTWTELTARSWSLRGAVYTKTPLYNSLYFIVPMIKYLPLATTTALNQNRVAHGPPLLQTGAASWLCPHPPYFLPQEQIDDDSNVGVRKLPTNVPNPACKIQKTPKIQDDHRERGRDESSSIRQGAARPASWNFCSMHLNNPTHVYSSLHM